MKLQPSRVIYNMLKFETIVRWKICKCYGILCSDIRDVVAVLLQKVIATLLINSTKLKMYEEKTSVKFCLTRRRKKWKMIDDLHCRLEFEIGSLDD